MNIAGITNTSIDSMLIYRHKSYIHSVCWLPVTSIQRRWRRHVRAQRSVGRSLGGSVGRWFGGWVGGSVGRWVGGSVDRSVGR